MRQIATNVAPKMEQLAAALKKEYIYNKGEQFDVIENDDYDDDATF